MRVGRRSRIAVTSLWVALVVVAACLAGGQVHPARAARAAQLTGAAAAQEQDRKPFVARKRQSSYAIAFFGDSVSVGYGASRRGHGYVARVSSWLRSHGHRVHSTNHARGGVPVAYWMYAPMPTPLDAVVVELGTNDVRLGTSSTRFAHAYRTLTHRIAAANPKARLLCLSVWPRRGGSSFEAVVNGWIRAACPGTYVDITRLRDRSHIRSSDGFHPNDLGYRLIARAVVSKLKLQASPTPTS